MLGRPRHANGTSGVICSGPQRQLWMNERNWEWHRQLVWWPLQCPAGFPWCIWHPRWGHHEMNSWESPDLIAVCKGYCWSLGKMTQASPGQFLWIPEMRAIRLWSGFHGCPQTWFLGWSITMVNKLLQLTQRKQNKLSICGPHWPIQHDLIL